MNEDMNMTADGTRNTGGTPMLPVRMDTACALMIESAQVEGEMRRIKGVANTFGVMRSGRILHPAPMEALLERTGGQVDLPLLAQHGLVPGFATIGRIDRLKVTRSKGLLFEATLAQGIELGEQAWTLIQQGLLATVSIGWVAKQARYVSLKDADLDPWLAKKLKEAGAEGAYAFVDWELVEVSLVDVPDDGGARLAARREEEERLAEEFHRRLKEALGQARGSDDEVVRRAVEASLKASQEYTERMLGEFAPRMENRLIETLEAIRLGAYDADEDDADEAAGADSDDGADAPAAAPPASEDLAAALMAIARKLERGAACSHAAT